MTVLQATDTPDIVTPDGIQIWVDANQQPHRDNDLPAIVYPDGAMDWCQHGLLHRDNDLPARITPDGAQEWSQHGVRHRDGDQPAQTHTDGYKAWWHNGQLHRDGDQPARIMPDGSMLWYFRGEHHRLTGPATINTTGSHTEEWWVHNRHVHSTLFYVAARETLTDTDARRLLKASGSPEFILLITTLIAMNPSPHITDETRTLAALIAGTTAEPNR